jgi:lipopolysaccharide heptosyltransferase II
MQNTDKDNLKRILIVNVNWLGDVLFSTVAIKAIKKRYPDCFLGCVVTPRCKQILEDNPYVDEILTFDERQKHKSLVSKVKFILKLRKKKFDAVVLFHRSFTRLLICYLAGIKRRIGYYRKKGGFLLTDKIELPGKQVHRAEYFTHLVSSLKVEIKERNYEFFVNKNSYNDVKSILSENGLSSNEKIIVLNPGGNWALKRWPVENFAKLADKINEELNMKVVISGANKDIELADKIVSMMKTKALILAGRTDLKGLAALFKMADAVVSADSGPMHLAAAVGSPVISIFGPTSPKITGPYSSEGNYLVLQHDVGCIIPCYELTCQDNKCMKAVTYEEVFRSIKKLLKYED